MTTLDHDATAVPGDRPLEQCSHDTRTFQEER